MPVFSAIRDSSRPGRSSRASTFDSERTQSRSSSKNSSRSASPGNAFGLLRKPALNRSSTAPPENSQDAKPEKPTVYLVIHKAEPKDTGKSLWNIVIVIPDGKDHIFDIVPDQKKKFRIREETVDKATLKSKFFEATIMVGTIPQRSVTLDHVLHDFRSYALDLDKPIGMGVIWVNQTVDKLEQIGELEGITPRTRQSIEEQVARLERRRKIQGRTR